MSKKLFLLWAVMSLVTYSGLLAESQSWSPRYSGHSCRKDIGASILMGILPPAWIVTLFVTGFYEHGFQFTCDSNGRES